MHKIELRSLKFGSYVKSILLVSIASGVIFGFLLLIIGIFGGDVEANLGAIELTGVAGGMASLIILPIIFSIFGLIVSLLTFIPFRLMLKVLKKINIYGEFISEKSYESSDSIEKDSTSKED